jgi:membrane associated rhomboid family serine protease
MGIYDRDYYRREGPSFLGSFSERGRMCKYLIIINVVCFLTQWATMPMAPDVAFSRDGRPVDVGLEERDTDPRAVDVNSSGAFTDALRLDARAVYQGQLWRLLTYSFLHQTGGGLPWHILFNMLFLWWFGSDVEDMYGPREFLAIYLTAAVLGGIAFTVAWKLLPVQGMYCIGASGAVMAVLVLCALHFPTRVIYLFLFLPVPIWLFVIFEVGQDALTFLSHRPSQTAVSVHLAGAAFAFVYYQMHWRLITIWNSLRLRPRQLFRPKLRVYREEPRQPVPVAAPAAADVDEQLEAKLDAVLEKVARHGKQSLTESENQILLRASEIYKRRRT